MELGNSAVAVSPFWAALRRRHPDVDLVLVAGPPRVQVPADRATPDAGLEAAVDRVTAHATGAWAQVLGRGEPLIATLEPGPAEHTVVARTRASARLDASPLPALELALTDGGWSAQRPDTAMPVLTARRTGVTLLASYAPTGVVTLTVSSTPLAVGVERARELVG